MNKILKRNLTNRHFMSLVFTDPLFYVGFSFLAIGLFLTIMAFQITDFASITFEKDLLESNGKLTKIKDAKYSENDDVFFEYSYVFYVNDKKYNGKSYDTLHNYNLDSIVQIEYQQNNPSKSRIKNMRMAPCGVGWFLFSLIFPLVGLILILLNLKYLNFKLKYIKQGLLSRALILNKKKIIPDDSDTLATYNIEIQYLTIEKSYVKSLISLTVNEIDEDEIYVDIIYLPWKPSDAIPLRQLPNSVRDFVINTSIQNIL